MLLSKTIPELISLRDTDLDQLPRAVLAETERRASTPIKLSSSPYCESVTLETAHDDWSFSVQDLVRRGRTICSMTEGRGRMLGASWFFLEIAVARWKSGRGLGLSAGPITRDVRPRIPAVPAFPLTNPKQPGQPLAYASCPFLLMYVHVSFLK